MKNIASKSKSKATPLKTICMVALPIAAAFIVYFNTLSADFVHDDNVQIVDNPWVHQIKYLPKLVSNPVWSFRSSAPTNYYRPIQMSLYNLLWVVFDGRPMPFHLVNILFHLIMIAALTLLIYRLTADRLVACGAALLFAIHPVNTETVAWIACLPDLSYSLFTIITLILHCASRDYYPSRNYYRLLALLASSIAIFSKETGLILIPLIFLLEIWIRPMRRLPNTLPKGVDYASLSEPLIIRNLFDPRVLVRAAWVTFPYIMIAAVYMIIRWLVIGGMAPMIRVDMTITEVLINAPKLFLSYFKVMILPVRLLAHHIFEPLPSVFHPGFIIGLPAALMIPIVLLYAYRRRPDLAFATVLICLPLLPVLYVPAVGSNAFAERYVYLSSAALTWIFIASLAAAAKRLAGAHGGSKITIVVAILLALPLSMMSIRRNLDWQNDERLALSTLREEPRATLMYVVLGNFYERRKLWEQALCAYEAGAQADPQQVALLANVINLQLQLGKISPDEAIEEYSKLNMDSNRQYELYAILGDAYLHALRFNEAEECFLQAIKINPNDGLLYNRLAVVYATAGRLHDARQALLKALEIDPNLEVAEDNLHRLEQMEEDINH